MKRIKNIDRDLTTLVLFFLFIITLLQIVLRALFNLPLVGVEELSRYLFISVVFLGLPYYYREDGHIKLDGAKNFLPPRINRILELLIEASSVLVFASIFVSAVYTSISNYDSTSPTLSIPFWVFFMPTILGFGLLLKEHLITLIKQIKREE